MTEIVFETATIASAIKKAADVAPSKAGAAFDQAAGVVMEIDPDGKVKCIVRATNLDVFYMESIDCISASGVTDTWRLPSRPLSQIMENLSTTSGKNVTLRRDGNRIRIEAGRMRAGLNLIMAEFYPEWDAYDTSALNEVPDLASKIASVAWAAAKDTPPWCGIHFDGEYIIATDRYRMACVPCSIDLPRPVTLPASIAAAVIKESDDLRIGLSASSFLISPDDFTQFMTVIYDLGYPPVRKMMENEYTQHVKVGKNNLAERINRTTAMTGSDRAPIIRMFYGNGEIAMFMANDEIGSVGDVIEVPGQIDHERLEILYTPKNLVDALRSAPGDLITISYDPKEPLYKPTKISGAQGYEAYIVPRRQETASE